MKTANKKEKAKKVNFSLLAPQAESVSIAGDFNDWNPKSHPMKRDKKGAWKASLNLAPGTYQYRFFVDGEWQSDSSCTDCVENPFGTLNCVKKVE
ncbi:MAG: isoamylase early set domain-containing protein [Deltaproteobacteria bacterium]|nr:isoamylase early set domain-containing protein [Deltaproteobacteria bacterium]